MVVRYKAHQNPLFSILICHISEREQQLQRLFSILNPQTAGKPVEVLINRTPKGRATIGSKRNRLLEEASGRFLAYIDDDDVVSEDYVALILDAIKTDVDCIGIVGVLKKDGKPAWTFRHSITVNRWCRDKCRRIYFRSPNHLNPIKSSIAKQVRFPESDFGEDKSYSDAIKPLLKTETFIEKEIYFYLK